MSTNHDQTSFPSYPRPIQIISAPSILGLWPSGVEHLADTLLDNGLLEKLRCQLPVVVVPTLNHEYNETRDQDSSCLNTDALERFSKRLSSVVQKTLHEHTFPIVLGGDCSILIGIMHAIKSVHTGGLIFIDAHADFCLPHQSNTGQVADMDLAIVTGRGPAQLTDINQLSPYVVDAKVLHLAQRDQSETIQYKSQEIRESGITVLDLDSIQANDLHYTQRLIRRFLSAHGNDKFWIHFDTDSLDDAINPAVDYRLPGGLSLLEANTILTTLFNSEQVCGMSVTIFNPAKDASGKVARTLVELISSAMYNSHFRH